MSALDLDSRPVLGPHVRLQMDAITGEPVLLYPEGILELNSTAHDVLRRCDGRTSLAAIVDALGFEYDVTPGELRADVLDCVAQLHARSFVVFAP